jgi:hypothetical protein
MAGERAASHLLVVPSCGGCKYKYSFSLLLMQSQESSSLMDGNNSECQARSASRAVDAQEASD